MFFKTLEIHGFKSFPDRTVIDFDRRITAVVGSNGNGKSNISDALRWVMGEQGAKTLRSEKMEDVIFHGTTERNPMGFAKVSLTLDNSDGFLDGQADEVVITRKLYRSGDSEYLINGDRVRLKDIQELLMGTGLGRDGYAIVGQGRVSEIVNAKTSQRREIFEEAAGVSKFLHKKQEAEKQLVSSEENIARQQDIVSELEARIPTLEKQVEKAKIFIELSEKQRRLEISTGIHNLSRLADSLNKISDERLLSSAEFDHTDKDIQKLESDSEEISLKRISLQSKIEDKRRGDSQKREELSAVKSEIAVCENDILHKNERILAIKEEIENRKRLEQENISQEENIVKEIAEKQAEISEASEKITAKEAELSSFTETLETENKEFQALDTEQSTLYMQEAECKISLAQAGEIAENVNNDIIRLKSEKQITDGKTDEYKELLVSEKSRISKLSELSDELTNKLSGYRRLFSASEEKLSETATRLDEVKRGHLQKSQRLQILQDVERNMEGYFQSVKQIIKASRSGRISGIHGIVGDILNVDVKYAAAVEIALGAALQNVVVENEETAKRCMKYLKDGNYGRATFLPLTSIKGSVYQFGQAEFEDGIEGIASELVAFDDKYDNIVKNLLGRTLVADNIDSAGFVAKKYGYKFRIVTLDGQVVNAGGSFTGGSLQKSAGIFSRKQELESLEREVESLSQGIDRLSGEHKSANEQFKKLSIETRGMEEELEAAERAKTASEAEAKRLSSLIEQLSSTLDSQSKLMENAVKKLEETGQKAAEISARLDEIRTKITANDEILSKFDESRADKEKQRQAFVDAISELKMNKISAEKDLESLENAKKQLEISKESIYNSSKAQQDAIVVLENEIKSVKSRIDELNNNCNLIENRISGAEDEIKEIISEMEADEKKLTEIRAEIRELNSVRESYSAKLARLEERQAAFQRDYDKTVSALWEKYELTVSEAKTLAEPVEDMVAAEAKLADYRRKISLLGNVNLAALEEYQEVSERYSFLSAQLEDVKKSKAELERLISDLTADIKKRFLDSFVEINRHFTEIFKQIFGGGTARLELCDPDNVLESGVEIYAAPPGKLIKNLMALSGGEQTMVAATIYFAVLRYRPAPFCMMDEVDAALDEANVLKYINYLKSYAGSTQLMVITHRRLTIEGCDVLYGVFMQEKGVSRLLRQEFSELQEDLN